jgi:predicted type IV restriction endonuclease
MPVTVVRLSDLNWQRLASGASAGIIANGDVIIVRDSPGAGVISRSPGATQTLTQEVTLELVQAVIQALQRDAQALVPGNPLREQAESFADTLHRDASMNRWESVKKTLSDVLAFAANGATLWAATFTILGPH